MSNLKQVDELFRGFSKLPRQERLTRLVQMGALTTEDIRTLNGPAKLRPELAEHLIENVIGYFEMPLGVATNFRINDKDYVIPMAVEETSIIAAASKTAKWIREKGEIRTQMFGDQLIGQIQFHRVCNYDQAAQKILNNKLHLIQQVNTHVARSMAQRGGGMKDLMVRRLQRPDGGDMLIIHVFINTCDAMGANLINQVCEFLKSPLETLIHETADMCILSNLNDRKITQAQVTLNNIDAALGEKIEEASLFAEQDPYRAATNNKGVLNAVDAILIATGNDWRAVEAGIHAYATRNRDYRSITTWRYKNQQLIGTLQAPIIVGTIGGVTNLHPTAKICLKMLNVKNADELSQVIAAAGLVQNLGAIHALTTVGIIKGHMKLHIDNLALGAGAEHHEIAIVKQRLEEIFTVNNRISMTNAIDVLKELRAQNSMHRSVETI